MSDLNSSLVGFLKKKSLFSVSPTKSTKPRDLQTQSNKKDNSSFINFGNPETKKTENYAKSTNLLNKHASMQNLGIISPEITEFRDETAPAGSFKKSPEKDSKIYKRNFSFKQFPQPDEHSKLIKAREEQKIWAGSNSKVASFESARLESIQCLDSMQSRIQSQIHSLSHKMQLFRSKLGQALDRQLQTVRQRIHDMVEQIFRESSQNLRVYVKQQEKMFAAELLAMHSVLNSQQQKISQMRKEILTSNWRKIAGQLLSSELEQQVADTLRKSRNIQIKPWMVQEPSNSKIVALQSSLCDIACLRLG